MINILATNDDGIEAPGLAALAAACADLGAVFVVAPMENKSGASSSLTLHSAVRVRRFSANRYAVGGTPTDCVHLALTGDFLPARPDIVVSGVNDGANMGDDTIYSGTVAAAIEGHLFNLPAIAVSLPGGGKRRFDTAAAFARDFAARLLAAKIDPNRPPPLFNINAPDVSPEAVRGARLTRLGRRHTAEKSKRIRDGEDEFWFEFGEAGDARDAGPETDFHAVERGFVSVTPLTADLTMRDVATCFGGAAPFCARNGECGEK